MGTNTKSIIPSNVNFRKSFAGGTTTSGGKTGSSTGTAGGMRPSTSKTK